MNSYIRVLLINQSGTVISETEVNATTGAVVRATPANGTYLASPKSMHICSPASVTNDSPVSSPGRKSAFTNCELAEYVFGSVALNFSGKSCVSKMHQLGPSTIITSNVFTVPVNNNAKSKVPRKLALVIVWNWAETTMNQPMLQNGRRNSLNGTNGVPQLETLGLSKCQQDSLLWKQLIYNQSDLIDSLLSDLRHRICEHQLSLQKIQISVTDFTQSICDLLAAERLSMQVSQAQFIDDLANLISKFDVKSTHFFVSRMISSLLIYKSRCASVANSPSPLRVVIFSQNAKNCALMKQILSVINYFLNNSMCHETTYSAPDFNEFEFKPSCEELTPPNRKSREEVSGYGSFTDSFTGSAHLNEACDHFCSQRRTSFSIDDLDGEATSEEGAEDNNNDDDVNNLDQTKLYIKEYHSLRFSKCPKCGLTTQPNESTRKFGGERLYQRDHALSISNINDNCNVSAGDSNCFGTLNEANSVYVEKIKIGESQSDTRKETIVESKEFPGFGQTHLPPLVVISRKSISTPIWKTPTISNNYLPKLQLQAIINQHCSFPQPKNDELLIFANIDTWTINICDKIETHSAMMSSTIGTMCEKVALLRDCDMNPKFIASMVELTLLELLHKSQILLSVLGEKCCKISTFDDNILDQINNSCNFRSLGFHISDVPLLISLQNQFNLTNYTCSFSKSFKREVNKCRLQETCL